MYTSSSGTKAIVSFYNMTPECIFSPKVQRSLPIIATDRCRGRHVNDSPQVGCRFLANWAETDMQASGRHAPCPARGLLLTAPAAEYEIQNQIVNAAAGWTSAMLYRGRAAANH